MCACVKKGQDLMGFCSFQSPKMLLEFSHFFFHGLSLFRMAVFSLWGFKELWGWVGGMQRVL